MTDRDQQLPHLGQVSYGEAVGSWHQTATAVRPRLCSFAGSQFCLSGQYFSWLMAIPIKRSGSEDLTQ